MSLAPGLPVPVASTRRARGVRLEQLTVAWNVAGIVVLVTEGLATIVDGLLATPVLTGFALNALFGAWWADPVAGLVIVYYGIREAKVIFTA